MRIMLLALVVACRGGNGSDDDTATAPTGTTDTSTDTTDTTDTDTTDTGVTTTTTDTGTAAVWTEESFQAPEAKLEDILFVVDNSCSMSDNQLQMSTGMQGFVDTLNDAGIEWHAGVTSTDMGTRGSPLQGRLANVGPDLWASPDTTDPAVWLQAAIQLGVNGAGQERGIAAAYAAAELRRDTDNTGFFRDDAGFHVVVLSDEQDQSDQMNPELVPIDDYIDWMEGQRGPNTAVSFSSFVCVAKTVGCDPFSLGTRYLDVTDAVGGIVWDVNDDIDLGINAVASNIVANAGFRTLELAETPADPATLEVTIDGVLLDATEYSYDVDSNSVVLTIAAPDGAEVVVRWPEA